MMLLALAVEPCTVAVTLTWSPTLTVLRPPLPAFTEVEPVTW